MKKKCCASLLSRKDPDSNYFYSESATLRLYLLVNFWQNEVFLTIPIFFLQGAGVVEVLSLKEVRDDEEKLT